jgi:hypothetical protein
MASAPLGHTPAMAAMAEARFIATRPVPERSRGRSPSVAEGQFPHYTFTNPIYLYLMSIIMIEADAQSSKILSSLAKRLGGKVVGLTRQQYEDFLLGELMEKSKTKRTVSRASVMKELRKK